MAAPQLTDPALESLIGEIADDFTRRHQRGEHPSLEEYAERYPDLAGLLREILPAIVALSPSSAAQRAETPRASQTAGGGEHVPPPASIGDYEIVAEIGRGGMGVVYKARHRALGRTVALKILRSRDAVDLKRFRHEAQAVALLQHSNVVQIFEVQEVDGQAFLALEYVAGGSLAERIKGEPQPPREAAALVETLARAIATAHDRGLVHRDLKPGNILLSNGNASTSSTTQSSPFADCTPKISDFGLAKRIDQDQGHTQTGAIVGTPSYMAPEQAVGGGAVGPAADIFALGAILYELIAGRPPFKGLSVLETLELVRHADPIPPSQLQPGCPRDLETICLKCLHKDPARRYMSAAALADDLRRFVNGEPIHARPVGSAERLGKWLRRRPAFAASLALGTLAALALVALGVRLAYSWELEEANQKLGEAVGAKESALIAAHDAQQTAERNHQKADDARGKLDAALERERALHYVHSIGLAQREWQANHVDEARRILDSCPADLRHWEWHYLYRQCHADLLTIRGGAGGITAFAVSPDGQRIAAASTGRQSAPPRMASDLKIWDAVSGELIRELVGQRGFANSVAFSPDGALLASTDSKIIRLWDLGTGQELRQFSSPSGLSGIAFSPDGARLAAASGGQIRVYDVATGMELFALAGHTQLVLSLAFSTDGNRLVTGGADRLVKLWDLNSRQEVFTCRGQARTIRNVAFSPEQDQIISCGDGLGTGSVRSEVRLWSAVDGKALPLTMVFPFRVHAATFIAGATQIACAADDGAVHVLDATTGKTAFVLRGHTDAVLDLSQTARGDRLVTGSADGTVRVWPVRNPEFTELTAASRGRVSTVALGADGRRLACGSYHQVAQPDANTSWLRIMAVLPGPAMRDHQASDAMLALAFDPDHRWLAAAERRIVSLWDLDRGRSRGSIAEPGVVGLSVSPDGQRLATATSDPTVTLRPDFLLPNGRRVLSPPWGEPIAAHKNPPSIKVWGVPDGQLQRVFPGQISAAFSPDGRRIAGAHGRHAVKVWDVATGEEICTLGGLADPVLRVQFVGEGRQVIGVTQSQATVWDVATGQTIAIVDGLKGPAFATPDGRRLVSLHDGSVKWWDVRLGRELLVLAVPDRRLQYMTLSADGRILAASVLDKVFVWQAPPP